MWGMYFVFKISLNETAATPHKIVKESEIIFKIECMSAWERRQYTRWWCQNEVSTKF